MSIPSNRFLCNSSETLALIDYTVTDEVVYSELAIGQNLSSNTTIHYGGVFYRLEVPTELKGQNLAVTGRVSFKVLQKIIPENS